MSISYGISWIYDEFHICRFQRKRLSDIWFAPFPVKNHNDFKQAIQESSNVIDIKKGSDVSIAFESDIHTHSFLELPPMTKKDIELYLEKHIEREKSFQEEAAWSYRSTPHGSKGEGVLLHMMPKDVLNEIISGCEKYGLEPRKILPLTDIMAAHIPRLPSKDNGIIILISLFNHHVEIVVADDSGESYFVRELSFDWSIENLERLRLEVERTLLYTKQQFQAASHIWIMGQDAHEISEKLKQFFDIPIEDEPEASASDFWSKEVCSLPNKSTSNFIANSIQSTITGRAAIRTGIWVAAASMIFSILSSLLFNSIKFGGNEYLMQDIEQLKKEKIALEKNVNNIENKNKKLRVLLDKPKPIAVWFLYDLGDILPNAMYLSHASIKNKKGQWTFVLEGASNPTLADSASTISELEYNLQQPPWKAKISQDWKTQWLDKLQKGKAGADVLIAFEIEGVI